MQILENTISEQNNSKYKVFFLIQSNSPVYQTKYGSDDFDFRHSISIYGMSLAPLLEGESR